MTRLSRPPRPSVRSIGNMGTTTTTTRRMGYEYDSHDHSRGSGSGVVPVRRPTRLRGRVDSAKAEELVAGLGFNVAGSTTSSPSSSTSSSSTSSTPDVRKGRRRRRADSAAPTPAGGGDDDDDQVSTCDPVRHAPMGDDFIKCYFVGSYPIYWCAL